MKTWGPPLLLMTLMVVLYFALPFNLAFLTRILIMVVLVLSLDLVLDLTDFLTIVGTELLSLNQFSMLLSQLSDFLVNFVNSNSLLYRLGLLSKLFN